MSLSMLEHVLYALTVDRTAKSAFRDDPDEFLASYRLGDGEADLIRAFDLYELAARGVNPMLLMGFWHLTREGTDAYLSRIATPLRTPNKPVDNNRPGNGRDR